MICVKIMKEKIGGIAIKMDVFGKTATELKKERLFLFDIDETIYEEERVFDGTRQLLPLGSFLIAEPSVR